MACCAVTFAIVCVAPLQRELTRRIHAFFNKVGDVERHPNRLFARFRQLGAGSSRTGSQSRSGNTYRRSTSTRQRSGLRRRSRQEHGNRRTCRTDRQDTAGASHNGTDHSVRACNTAPGGASTRHGGTRCAYCCNDCIIRNIGKHCWRLCNPASACSGFAADEGSNQGARIRGAE